MISPSILLPILSQVVVLILGLLVFRENPRGKINKIFILFVLSGIFWSLCNFLADFLKNYREVMFWSKASILGPVLMAAFYLYLSFIFPEEEKKSHRLKDLILIFFPGIIFFILSPSSFNIKDIKIQTWGAEITPGYLYHLLLLYLVIYFGIALKKLWSKYKESSIENEKHQILYFFLGMFFAVVIGLFTNLISPLLNQSYLSKIGPSFAVLAFTFFTSYAILKYHLFEIRVILTELLVALIGLALFIQIFSAPNPTWRILNSVIFVVFLFFGYSLIKSVLKEIKLREDLEKAYVELEKLDKAKSEFISISSHQLRTPLTAIKGYISMMLDGSYGPISSQLKGKLENVSQSNERLIRLINDLLSVSRIESGRLELNFKETNVEDVILSAVDTLKLEAKRKKVSLKWDKPKKALPKIQADTDKLREVILNIIDNAIKYTQKGHVKIETDYEDGFVMVKISDTGAGMTQEEIAKMFKSFSRGNAGNEFFTEGIGLGLYIARKFVEMHRGQIWAESEGRGKGSTFFIRLPEDLSASYNDFVKNF